MYADRTRCCRRRRLRPPPLTAADHAVCRARCRIAAQAANTPEGKERTARNLGHWLGLAPTLPHTRGCLQQHITLSDETDAVSQW